MRSRTLSQREQQVARLMAQGKANKEIAEELGIAIGTVKAHATAVFHIYEVRNRIELMNAMNQQAQAAGQQ